MPKKIASLLFIVTLITPLRAEEKSSSTDDFFLRSESVVDIGVVKAGSEFTHEFPIKNPFDGVFSIEKIDSSCRCTSAKASAESVAEGETLNVSVRIESGAAGVFRQSVVLVGHVNGRRAGLAVAIQGSVKAPLELEDIGRAWTIRGDLPVEESALELMLCSHWNEEKWGEPKVVLSYKAFKAEVIPDNDRSDCWKVRITPDLSAMDFNILNLTVQVFQAKEGAKMRYDSTSLFVRKASVFQATIPQSVRLSTKQKAELQAGTIHLHAYLNRELLKGPLTEHDIKLEVFSPISSKANPLTYNHPSMNSVAFKCQIDMRDVFSSLETLRTVGVAPSDKESVVGYIVLTYVPLGVQTRIPLLR